MSSQNAPIVLLPVELKRAILDYIPLPSDLSSLSLTCKTLHSCVVEFLHKHIVLSYALPKYPYDLRERYRQTDIVAIHNEQERKLCEKIWRVFKPHRPASVFVREIYLKMRLSSRWTPFRSPYIPARTLVESVPPNTLHAFRFDSAPFGLCCFTVTLPDLILLCNKQRELRFLKLSHPFFTGQTKRPYSIKGNLPGEGDFQLASLENLVLEWMPFYEEGDIVLRIGRNLLENCTKLQSLSLARLQTNICDEPPLLDLLCVKPPDPTKIRKLSLHRIDLKNVDVSEISVVSFRTLECLELNYVSGGYKLLAAITSHQDQENSHMKELILCESTPFWDSLESFLSSFSTLRLFSLSYTREANETLFNMGCLSPHAHTLRTLLLEHTTPIRNYPPPKIVYHDEGEIEWLCATFTQLRELGLNLDRRRYSFMAQRKDLNLHPAISTLKHLHTFNDSARDHLPNNSLPIASLGQSHDEVKNGSTFQICVKPSPPNLRVLVVGSHGRSHDRQIFWRDETKLNEEGGAYLTPVSRVKLSFLESERFLAGWEPWG